MEQNPKRPPGHPKGTPRSPTSGRKKGTPNKLQADLKAVIIEAFEKLGGVAYLIKVGQDDQRTFCALLSKILPRDVNLEANLTMSHEERLKRLE